MKFLKQTSDILKKCEVGEWDYFSMKSYIMDALRYAYKIIPKVPIDEVDIKKNNPELDLQIQKRPITGRVYTG